MAQIIYVQKNSGLHIGKIIREVGCTKFLLVCGSSFEYLDIKKYMNLLPIPYVVFQDFSSNPLYEDVCKGVHLFHNENCDCIIAIGGGSAMDVAKCIKLFCKMNQSQNYLTQEGKDSGIPLIAIPTTAGTGSESTRYAVIYYEDKKQSITHESILPNYAILDSSMLKTLPIYQKKCTMLDALCQGIESWWSIHSSKESKSYSKQAVELIMQNKDAYLHEDSEQAAEKIMLASNFAGRAIHITQTTAAHAMSYKITSRYHLPHGHAVAICLPYVWDYMLNHLEDCIDLRGRKYLHSILTDISKSFQCDTNQEAIAKFHALLKELDITAPRMRGSEELEILTKSVNPIRLKNNPVRLHEKELSLLYHQILFYSKRK